MVEWECFQGWQFPYFEHARAERFVAFGLVGKERSLTETED